MLEMFKLAAKMALPTSDIDNRGFLHGCVGIREDGAVVYSRNGAVKYTSTIEHYQLIPNSHAEGRVLRKLGKGGIIYVARISKKDGTLTTSAPCAMCSIRIKAFKVRKVFYSLNQTQYGVWDVKKDIHRIYNF